MSNQSKRHAMLLGLGLLVVIGTPFVVWGPGSLLGAAGGDDFASRRVQSLCVSGDSGKIVSRKTCRSTQVEVTDVETLAALLVGYLDNSKAPESEQGSDSGSVTQGPQGEIGPVGPQGPVGPAGPEGPQGERGLKGDRGEKGAEGPEGPQGDLGPKGLKGERGEVGLKGETGPAGAEGPKGDRGDVGPKGAKGDKGDKGEAGATGAQGPRGLDGPMGLRGPQGLTGSMGAPGPAGPQGLQGPMGAQGPQGEIGPQGPKGSDATVTVLGRYKFSGSAVRARVGLPPQYFVAMTEPEGTECFLTSVTVVNPSSGCAIGYTTVNGKRVRALYQTGTDTEIECRALCISVASGNTSIADPMF